jgi:hypothetical protein
VARAPDRAGALVAPDLIVQPLGDHPRDEQSLNQLVEIVVVEKADLHFAAINDHAGGALKLLGPTSSGPAEQAGMPSSCRQSAQIACNGTVTVLHERD